MIQFANNKHFKVMEKMAKSDLIIKNNQVGIVVFNRIDLLKAYKNQIKKSPCLCRTKNIVYKDLVGSVTNREHC